MSTKMKKWIVVALASAASAVGIFLVVASVDAEQPADGAGRPDARSAPAAAGHGGAPAPSGGNGQLNSWAAVVSSANSAAMDSPLSTMTPPVFAADSRGKLVLNADTHANLEKLLLEENPETLAANLDKAAKVLPTQAAAELKVLSGQFQQYAKALTHTIPPETAPETEPERLKMLDSLHALRVSYLGAEAAQAMFGEEEAMTRKLIALMAAQDDPNLTPEQKAERAQEMVKGMRQTKPPPAS
ncbi:MAG TPA: lipase secretion chaperone [Duganella sp.]|nr:lipase secretion chaperone [Duganella sp.]